MPRFALASLVIAIAEIFANVAHADLPRGCTRDAGLDELALLVHTEPGELSGETLASLGRRAGIGFPSVKATRGEPSARAHFQRWIEDLRERADAPIYCGEATSESLRTLVAAYGGGRLTRQGAHLHIHLEPGFDRATLVLEPEAPRPTWYHEVSEAELAEGFPIPRDLVQAQLVAYGPRGMRPVASLCLVDDCEASSPQPLGARAESSAEALAVVERPHTDIRGMVDDVRREMGVGELRDNRLMQTVARDHARSVCGDGRALHQASSGRDPEARLRRRGIEARVVGEVVARGDREDGLRTHFLGMLRSLSHREALIDARMTDVGAATIEQGSARCTVILLAAWPRATMAR